MLKVTLKDVKEDDFGSPKVITNNAGFDTYYYPDSDKVFVSALLGANKEVGKEARWTRFKEGTATNYWDGEE